MDGMALLCNLHAGGPTTLQRLRHAGIRRLEQLARVDELELARLLGASPPAARRFALEAQLLELRLGESAPADDGVPLVELRPAPRVAAHPRRPVDPVEHARLPASAPAPSPAPAPAPAPRLAPGELLRPGLLEGLTRRVCERLIAQGVRTVDDLLRTANLNLARRISLSYPMLLDLAHEARERGSDSGPAGPFAAFGPASAE